MLMGSQPPVAAIQGCSRPRDLSTPTAAFAAWPVNLRPLFLDGDARWMWNRAAARLRAHGSPGVGRSHGTSPFVISVLMARDHKFRTYCGCHLLQHIKIHQVCVSTASSHSPAKPLVEGEDERSPACEHSVTAGFCCQGQVNAR